MNDIHPKFTYFQIIAMMIITTQKLKTITMFKIQPKLKSFESRIIYNFISKIPSWQFKSVEFNSVIFVTSYNTNLEIQKHLISRNQSARINHVQYSHILTIEQCATYSNLTNFYDFKKE